MRTTVSQKRSRAAARALRNESFVRPFSNLHFFTSAIERKREPNV